RRLAECCLNRLTKIVGVAHDAALEGRPSGILTLFDLGADLHLVIGSEERPVLAEARRDRRPFQLAATESLRPTALNSGCHVHMIGSRAVSRGRLVGAGRSKARDAHIQKRVVRERVGQLAERTGGARSTLDDSRGKWLCKRGSHRIGPELVMETAHPLHALIDLPGHFAEGLVVLAAPREQRIRPRLAVRVAQILITAEEPGTVAHERSAKMCCEVSISHAGVFGRRFAAASAGEFDRMAGQTVWLAVVREVRCEKVSALLGHNVEHAALDVAEFHARADRVDVNLLDDVDVWLWLWTSGARAREVGAIQQIQILVHARTEDGHAGIGAARSGGGRHARRRSNQIEHTEASNWNRAER